MASQRDKSSVLECPSTLQGIRRMRCRQGPPRCAIVAPSKLSFHSFPLNLQGFFVKLCHLCSLSSTFACLLQLLRRQRHPRPLAREACGVCAFDAAPRPTSCVQLFAHKGAPVGAARQALLAACSETSCDLCLVTGNFCRARACSVLGRSRRPRVKKTVMT